MTIARKPHPVFALCWVAWSIYMFTCVFLAGWLYDVILWTSWAGIEGSGVLINTGMRDTQSEIATWTHRKLAKGPLATVPIRGWNAILFTPYVGCIGLNLFQLAQGRGFLLESFGALVACSVCVGLWDHWTAPQVHG